VGLGTIRGVVIGMEDRPALPEEMDAMTKEVLRAIEQGCWGVSTGLEYTPGSFASTEEIWKILSAVPERYRLYSTHMRNEDNEVLEAIDEAVTIARNSKASLQVSHLKASYKVNWHKQEVAIRMLEDARAAGVNAHADRYPYIAYNTDLAALFPIWSREGGMEKFLGRLHDKAVLPQIKEAVEKKINGLGSWDSVMISSVRTEGSRPLQGKTMLQIATQEGTDPFDALVDLMIREDGRVGMVGFGMDEAGTEMVLAWKFTMIASDAGSYSPKNSTSRPHPRAYGTFPRAIAHYQRTRNITTLPDMIRKMTSLPAGKLGLKDRGVIAIGNWADLVLFDYDKIEDRATFLDPHQFPAGIPWVLVNGVPVVERNVQTDALPGHVLRST
jgi:N-acyl-D-amino-acid deacylase